MRFSIKKIITKIPIFSHLARYLYIFLNDKILNFFFQFFPEKGKKYYVNMQKENYKKFTENFLDTKNLCVGNFNAQESYPYKTYLLEHYKGNKRTALDFACGMGRMMLHMSNEFKVVDGVDLNQNNLSFAKKHLSENNLSAERYNLYLSDGLSVDIPKKKYDFIYSTIALQHICVHKIRFNIIKDLYKHLNQNGAMCLQFGFGYDNGISYFDNFYSARGTNAAYDICIPNESYLPYIEKEFYEIGFKKLKYEFKISPHPQMGNIYHPIWLFIHLQNFN